MCEVRARCFKQPSAQRDCLKQASISSDASLQQRCRQVGGCRSGSFKVKMGGRGRHASPYDLINTSKTPMKLFFSSLLVFGFKTRLTPTSHQWPRRSGSQSERPRKAKPRLSRHQMRRLEGKIRKEKSNLKIIRGKLQGKGALKSPSSILIHV